MIFDCVPVLEPEIDRDEVYPVDFVSQLYYRIHTMCGGRSSRNEAELLIPKFSKNEGDAIAPVSFTSRLQRRRIRALSAEQLSDLFDNVASYLF